MQKYWHLVDLFEITKSVLSIGVRSPASLLHNEAFDWRLQVRMKMLWYQYWPQNSKVCGCRTSCISASKRTHGWQPVRTLVGTGDVLMGESRCNFHQGSPKRSIFRSLNSFLLYSFSSLRVVWKESTVCKPGWRPPSDITSDRIYLGFTALELSKRSCLSYLLYGNLLYQSELRHLHLDGKWSGQNIWNEEKGTVQWARSKTWEQKGLTAIQNWREKSMIWKEKK